MKSLEYRQRFRTEKQTWETTSYLWNMLEEVQASHQVKPIPPMEGDGWGKRGTGSGYLCLLLLSRPPCSRKGFSPPHHGHTGTTAFKKIFIFGCKALCCCIQAFSSCGE